MVHRTPQRRANEINPKEKEKGERKEKGKKVSKKEKGQKRAKKEKVGEYESTSTYICTI